MFGVAYCVQNSISIKIQIMQHDDILYQPPSPFPSPQKKLFYMKDKVLIAIFAIQVSCMDASFEIQCMVLWVQNGNIYHPWV